MTVRKAKRRAKRTADTSAPAAATTPTTTTADDVPMLIIEVPPPTARQQAAIDLRAENIRRSHAAADYGSRYAPAPFVGLDVVPRRRR
ncbi:MAG TPA: hypothetical protein VGI90_09900 [Steroidobacteraceae bacterium]